MHMRFGYLSLFRAAKPLASLSKCTDSPQTQMKTQTKRQASSSSQYVRMDVYCRSLRIGDINRLSPAQFENRIKPRVYVRHFAR